MLTVDPDNPESYSVTEARIWNPTVLADLIAQLEAGQNEGVRKAVDGDRHEMWHVWNDRWVILLYNKSKPVRATIQPLEEIG
ncbi:hypothetical protein ACF3MZ_16870 [Paenibacillaceae bacterium WGS1546]|uniref:hypothetical protein n=1 Tax=Cohnella sp. WGS1546 TaxID=3366810 RepID=UPI00372D31B4